LDKSKIYLIKNWKIIYFYFKLWLKINKSIRWNIFDILSSIKTNRAQKSESLRRIYYRICKPNFKIGIADFIKHT